MRRFLVIVLSLSVAATAQAGVRYEVIDLTDEFDAFTGGPDMVQTYVVNAIGNGGWLCGSWHSQVDNSGSAFAYSPEDGFIDLSSVVGDSRAWDINDNGQVVGTANFFDDRNYRAFVWDPVAGVRILEALQGFPSWGSINNAGQIAISLYQESGVRATWLWEDGTVTDIGHLGGYGTNATCINDLGEIAGSSSLPTSDPQLSPEYRPFQWTAQDGMAELGNFGPGSYISDINDSGVIAGRCVYPETGPHATLWVDGEPTNIDSFGFLDSAAVAVNDAGEVVGYGYLLQTFPDGTTYQERFALHWDAENDVCLLQDLLVDDVDWYISSASMINDEGWIFVNGQADPWSPGHLLLLKPIPEPSGILLLCAGSAFLLGYRHRWTSFN